MVRVLVWGVLTVSGLVACTASKPEPIQLGVDACTSCKMTLTDARFGGEILTSKGKAFKFDSLECLKSYLKKNPESGVKIFVVDSTRSGALIPAEKAIFVIDPTLRSPMGRGVIASESVESLSSFFAAQPIPSKRYTWSELLLELDEFSAAH